MIRFIIKRINGSNDKENTLIIKPPIQDTLTMKRLI